MAEIIWAHSAANDIEEICIFISIDSEEYARLFARGVIETIEKLADFPLSGRIVPEFQDESVRGKIYGN